MKQLTFNKEKGVWYIDLPTYPGPKADLAMVSGADILLDVLSLKAKSVTLEIALAPIDDYYRLKLLQHTPKQGGAVYKVFGQKKFPKEAWLCEVTKFVFGGYMPPEIYFRRIY